MVTYKKALETAKKQKPNIDTVAEYEDAYVFYNSKAKGNAAEDSEVVIRKKDGKVITMSQYVVETESEKAPKQRAV